MPLCAIDLTCVWLPVRWSMCAVFCTQVYAFLRQAILSHWILFDFYPYGCARVHTTMCMSVRLCVHLCSYVPPYMAVWVSTSLWMYQYSCLHLCLYSCMCTCLYVSLHSSPYSCVPARLHAAYVSIWLRTWVSIFWLCVCLCDSVRGCVCGSLCVPIWLCIALGKLICRQTKYIANWIIIKNTHYNPTQLRLQPE